MLKSNIAWMKKNVPSDLKVWKGMIQDIDWSQVAAKTKLSLQRDKDRITAEFKEFAAMDTSAKIDWLMNGDRHLGYLYKKDAIAFARREWKGLKSVGYDFVGWLKIWGGMLNMVMKDPVSIMLAVFAYHWFASYLATPAVVDRSVFGRRGKLRQADFDRGVAITHGAEELIANLIMADAKIGGNQKINKRIIMFDEMTMAQMMAGFPNLLGKWCRPHYNSAVATFCYNTAHDLPITVNDRATELELLYIDDLVEEMLDALEMRPHRCDYDGLTPVFGAQGRYCVAPVTHKVTLGEIVDLLNKFHDQSRTLVVPAIPAGSFAKKLYSTYLSYLPKEKVAFPLKMNVDARGSFTELLKTENCGQFSVNVSKPGITKGQHWHNTKWEFFIVVSGHGLIQERKVGCDEVMEFEVWGDKPTAVQMLPGCTHNIINLSDTENLVTLMWANEPFDPARPDTFFLKV